MKIEYIVLGIVFLLLLIFFFFPFSIGEIGETTTTTTPAGSSGGGSSSGGGGGGGGTTTTTSASGTTTTQPVEGDNDGDGCIDCEASFIGDESGEVIETTDGGDGIVAGISNFFSGLFNMIVPRANVEHGHWECTGDCVNPLHNCVLNPIDEIPQEGYTDINSPPDCVCLPKAPGECNWYDANYGQGSDDIQCGGSCKSGRCTSFIVNGKAICDCLESDSDDECRWRLIDEENSIYNNEWICDGDCPKGTECIIIESGSTEICTCVGDGEEEKPCDWYKDDSGHYVCEGKCDTGLKCAEWMYGQECGCVDPDTGYPPGFPCEEIPYPSIEECSKGWCPDDSECIYEGGMTLFVQEYCYCKECDIPPEEEYLCENIKDPYQCQYGWCPESDLACAWDYYSNSCMCVPDWEDPDFDCENWACDGMPDAHCNTATTCKVGFFHQEVGDKYCSGGGWCCCPDM